MNNLRLLAGAVCALLLPGASVCAYGQQVWTLEDIFASADARALSLRPSVTDTEAAAREVSVARSQRLPDIEASMSVGYLGDGFTVKRDFSDYQPARNPHLSTGLGLTVTQPVYTGGAITNGIRMAELKSTAARYAEELRRDDLRLTLTGYYLDLYKYDNLLRVVDANITSARKVLADMQARYSQGTALRNDITRYELLVSNLELQKTKISNTIDILNHNLVETAGLPSGTTVIPDSAILDRAMPAQTEADWQQAARLGSPALALSRTGQDIQGAAEALTRAERLPKIGIQAGWTMDGPITVEVPPVNRNLSYWWAGVSVSYSLSSLYKTNRKLTAARLAVEKARQETEAAEQGTALAVRSAYIRYREAYDDLATSTKSVELAHSNYKVIATRFDEGMALITDMLDAANSRLDAEQTLVNSRINIIYCYYKLLFITGKI